MALTTGRYQTCPTAPTPRGYLLIAFLNHTEQAIATGLQTADKELQGLVWAGGWGLGCGLGVGGVLGCGCLSSTLCLLWLCLHTSLPTWGLKLPGGAMLRADG